MESMDVLALDLSDNESMAEFFSRKEAGDTCPVTIAGKFKIDATITEVEPGKCVRLSLATEESSDEEGNEQEPQTPVDAVMPMKGMKRKKEMMAEEEDDSGSTE